MISARELKELINTYIAKNAHIMDEDHRYPDDPRWGAYSIGRLSEMRHPTKSRGRCGLISQDLYLFLRDLEIESHFTDDPVHGVIPRPAGSKWQDPTPDDHGYADRPFPGMEDHVALIIPTTDGPYMLDFAASQYGYTNFPLVQRKAETGWKRITLEEIA